MSTLIMTTTSLAMPVLPHDSYNSTTTDTELVTKDVNTFAFDVAVSSTSVSTKLNSAMDGQGWGVIFRNRFDGMVECGQTYDKKSCRQATLGAAPSTYWHNDAFAPNPAYCIENVGGCEETPTVGYVTVDAWAMNGGPLKGFAYFASDANAVDHRDWAGRQPGQGCHQYQVTGPDGCEATKTCYTYRDAIDPITKVHQPCKCDYDHARTRDGKRVFLDFSEQFKHANYFGDEILDVLKGDKVPSYKGQDFSACWFEESDFLTKRNMDLLTGTQNSLYMKRMAWWNGGLGGNPGPDHRIVAENQYQGWNEVAMDYKIDYDDYKLDKGGKCSAGKCIEALVIVMPVSKDSLSELSPTAKSALEATLLKYWCDGYGHTPVVMMRQEQDPNEHYKYKKVAIDLEKTFVFSPGYFIEYQPASGSSYFTAPNGHNCAD